MPIPDYQTLMRPVLVTLDSRGDMSLRQLVDLLSDQCQLTDDERRRMTPSMQSSLKLAAWHGPFNSIRPTGDEVTNEEARVDFQKRFVEESGTSTQFFEGARAFCSDSFGWRLRECKVTTF